MEVLLNQIENIKPVMTSTKKTNYRSIYALLCGVECEYALGVLKKNKEDALFKQIASFYLTRDISAKTLFKECFSFDEEMADLHSRLRFEETDESYTHVLNSIKWDCSDENNIFCVGDYKFSVPKVFLDLKELNGKFYALERKLGDDKDSFEVIGKNVDVAAELNYEANSSLKSLLSTEGVDFSKYKYTDTPKLSDDEFFQVTNKLKETDDEQKESIRANTDRNLLIIAGAGSGKTRSLVGRLTYLHIVKGIPLNKIMLLTFTRAATQEMAGSAYQQIKEAYLTCGMTSIKNPHVLANTIDGFFKQLIDRYYLDMGLVQKPSFLLENDNVRERLRMLAEVINENQLNNVFKEYISDEKNMKRLYTALADCANGMMVNVSGVENLLDLFVQKQIRDCKIVDFDYNALIIKRALQNPECPLYSRIENMYECILIDEFQDINKLQNAVLSKFYDGSIHFTFVGDDDQTIYTWRGADNSIIKQMAVNPRVNTVYLTTNYRSNPYIVNAGNDILQSLDDRAKQGRVIHAAKKTGSKVKITRYDEHYANLAHEIKKVYNARTQGEKICVLCRQINDKYKVVDGKVQKIEGEGKKIARMLELERVPTVFSSDDGLVFSDGYRLLKSIVYILNKIDVRNNCAYIKELTGTSASNTNIRRLVFGKMSSSQFDGNYSMDYSIEMVAELAKSLNSKYNYAYTVFDLISNYNRCYAEVVEGQKDANRSVRDETLTIFQQMAGEYNWDYPRKKIELQDVFNLFEEEVSRKTTKKVDDDDNKSDSIIISSIHKAKGLQYDTVFIVGLNDGEYPNSSQIIAEYNKRVSEFQKLKISQTNLGRLRTSVTQATIDKLIAECKSPVWSKFNDQNLLDDMSAMAEDVDACADDYITLSEDGVNDFLSAFEVYINRHINYRRDVIYKKASEIAARQEAADQKEEEYHEADDDSPAAQQLFQEWHLINQEVKIKQESLDAYNNNLKVFLGNITNLLAFYEICNEAKGYMADVIKLLNETPTIKKLEKEKQDKENEEKRLFYVAVSRASEMLYLCVRDGSYESPFIKLINSNNCERYVMHTQAQEEEIKRLEQNIKEIREEVSQVKIDDKKVDKGIEKILNYSEAFKEEMQIYLAKYLDAHPIYRNISKSSKVYFDNAIGLLALSEKLGYNFKTEIVHNLQKFMQQLLIELIGSKAKSYKTDSYSAEKITRDIRIIAKNKCKAGIPGEGYLMDLLTKESKYSDVERCKSLVVQCYVVCSGKYHIVESISETWNIKKFYKGNPDDFLVAALDLTNIRNVMVHDLTEIWTTDYLPYAFDCLDTVMGYITPPPKTVVQYNDDVDLDESIVSIKLKSIIASNANAITDIKKLYSLVNDFFESKIAKVLCIVDAKVLKDIVSGVINSRRGTDLSYLRNNSNYSSDMCLQVISIWENVVDNQTKSILKQII